MPLTPEIVPLPHRARVPRRFDPQLHPRDWRILVPLSAVGHGWRVVDPSGPRGETYVDVDPGDPQVAFRDLRLREVVDTLAELLADDPYIVQAFHLLRLARSLKRDYEPAQGRVIPLARALADQPVRFVVLPAGDAKLRHSARPFAYLEPVPAGYLRAETGGSSAILIYGPSATTRIAQLRRSLLHEMAHYINHLMQDSGLPYSGRERRHSLYDIRTAAFAYVEGEPQAFLAFVERLVGEDRLIRHPKRRADWVSRLLTPNQFLRSELACGKLLGALLNDRSIRNHYLRPSFYEPVASNYPALKGHYRLKRAQVRAAVPPAENAWLKVQYVRLRHDPADTLEFLRAYLTEFPSQRRLALRVIAGCSSGLLVSPEAERDQRKYAAARIRAAATGDWREARTVRDAARRAWTQLVRRGCGLVGDPRTPLVARTSKGEVDLNRDEAARIARVLRIRRAEAAKVERNRDALRPREYLEPTDVTKPPPRALRPNVRWEPLTSKAARKITAALDAAGPASGNPLRRALEKVKLRRPKLDS